VIFPATTIVKVVIVATDVVYQFTTLGVGNVGVTGVAGVMLRIEKIKSSAKHCVQLTVNLSRIVSTLVWEEPTEYSKVRNDGETDTVTCSVDR
jgi:hypothetical protein